MAECIGRGCANERVEGFEWCEECLTEIARRFAEQVTREAEGEATP